MILLRRLPKSFFSWPSRRTLFAPNILQFTPSNLSNATHTAFRPQKLPVKKFSPPPQLIFWGILTLNGLVYLLWSNATSQYVRPPISHHTYILGLKQMFSKYSVTPVHTSGCVKIS